MLYKIILSALVIAATQSSGPFYDASTSGSVGSVDGVDGPAIATNEALVRFDGTTGKLVKNSVLICTNAGAVSGMTALAIAYSSTTTTPQMSMLQSGSGDASSAWVLNGTHSYAAGVDNTTDAWVLSYSATGTPALGTNNLLSIATTGNATFAADIAAVNITASGNVGGTISTAVQPNVTTMAGLASVQGQTVTLGGTLNVSSGAGTINQSVASGASPTFGTVTATNLGGTLSTSVQPNVTSLAGLTTIAGWTVQDLSASSTPTFVSVNTSAGITSRATAVATPLVTTLQADRGASTLKIYSETLAGGGGQSWIDMQSAGSGDSYVSNTTSTKSWAHGVNANSTGPLFEWNFNGSGVATLVDGAAEMSLDGGGNLITSGDVDVKGANIFNSTGQLAINSTGGNLSLLTGTSGDVLIAPASNQTTVTGSLTTSGDIVVAGSNATIEGVSGTAGSLFVGGTVTTGGITEGGQITLGYAGNSTGTGEEASTWNIDVDTAAQSNRMRFFANGGGGMQLTTGGNLNTDGDMNVAGGDITTGAAQNFLIGAQSTGSATLGLGTGAGNGLITLGSSTRNITTGKLSVNTSTFSVAEGLHVVTGTATGNTDPDIAVIQITRCGAPCAGTPGSALRLENLSGSGGDTGAALKFGSSTIYSMVQESDRNTTSTSGLAFFTRDTADAIATRRLNIRADGDVEQIQTRAGATNEYVIQNVSNTSSSNARLLIRNGGSSGGDVFTTFDEGGVGAWSIGRDVSTNNYRWTADTGGTYFQDGSTEVASMTPAGNLQIDGDLSVDGGDIITASGALNLTPASGTINLAGTINGDMQFNIVNNRNLTSTDDAFYKVAVGGSSGGDPFIAFDISSEFGMSMGLDNDSSNTFKITNTIGGVSSGTTLLSLTTAGALDVDSSIQATLGAGAGAGAVCSSAAANGTFTYSAGATCTVSSRRYKHSIVDSAIDPALLYKLRVVDYVLNSDKTNQSRIGLIAEEVAEVLPQLAVKLPDGTVESIWWERVTALTVAAVQDLRDSVDALWDSDAAQEERIATLEAQNAALAARLDALEKKPK